MGEIKVIGGEFEIPLHLSMSEDTDIASAGDDGRNYYTCGRACLYAILRNIADISGKYERILVPDYICASVTKTIKEAGYDFSFYRIERNLLPNEKSLCEGLLKEKIVLLVNYFGISDLKETISFIRSKAEKAIIIIDNVQNYYGFNSVMDFDYTFTSFRKWFPVPDGAELLTKKVLPCGSLINFNSKNEFAQYKFAGNVLKNFRGAIDDALCLELLAKGETLLDKGGYQCKCTEYSRTIIKKLDKEECAEKRKRNAKTLHEGLEKIGITDIYREGAVPLFVPVLLKDRTQIRKKLFEHSIFCPVHWPYESKTLQGGNALYDMELSLICDQRYNENDMKRILEILERECKNQQQVG